MLNFKYISNLNQLNDEIQVEEAVDFLHKNLDKFSDDKTAIRKSIDYAFSDEPGKGGFLVLAKEDSEIVGILVMNKTGMNEYIPDYLLVYIAVRADQRGKGIGSQIIQSVMKEIKSPIALHVEYDNPAKRLYERLGFTSKYAEMRFNPENKL